MNVLSSVAVKKPALLSLQSVKEEKSKTCLQSNKYLDKENDLMGQSLFLFHLYVSMCIKSMIPNIYR